MKYMILIAVLWVGSLSCLWEPRRIDCNERIIKLSLDGHTYYVTQLFHDPECHCAFEPYENHVK